MKILLKYCKCFLMGNIIHSHPVEHSFIHIQQCCQIDSKTGEKRLNLFSTQSWSWISYLSKHCFSLEPWSSYQTPRDLMSIDINDYQKVPYFIIITGKIPWKHLWEQNGIWGTSPRILLAVRFSFNYRQIKKLFALIEQYIDTATI